MLAGFPVVFSHTKIFKTPILSENGVPQEQVYSCLSLFYRPPQKIGGLGAKTLLSMLNRSKKVLHEVDTCCYSHQALVPMTFFLKQISYSILCTYTLKVVPAMLLLVYTPCYLCVSHMMQLYQLHALGPGRLTRSTRYPGRSMQQDMRPP